MTASGVPFYSMCDKDEPNLPVIQVYKALKDSFADCWIFSGRSDKVREQTETWLHEHVGISWYSLKNEPFLVMRQVGDYTPDDVLKEQWLNNMLVGDRERLVAVFDDRKKVVDMWRRNGITCFQVAPGEF